MRKFKIRLSLNQVLSDVYTLMMRKFVIFKGTNDTFNQVLSALRTAQNLNHIRCGVTLCGFHILNA